jgi:hypothetical protein
LVLQGVIVFTSLALQTSTSLLVCWSTYIYEKNTIEKVICSLLMPNLFFNRRYGFAS